MFRALAYGTAGFLGLDARVPLTTNNFEIRIVNNDGTPFGPSDLLTLSTDSIGAIEEEQDIIIVHYGNGILKYPSKVTFPDTEWVLNCFTEPNVLQALRDWRELIQRRVDQRMGLPSEYMKSVYFLKYDGQYNLRDVIHCPGTWIGAMSNGDMNQEGGAIVQATVPLIISQVIYLRQEEWR